jgi:hypothetical protein
MNIFLIRKVFIHYQKMQIRDLRTTTLQIEHMRDPTVNRQILNTSKIKYIN